MGPSAHLAAQKATVFVHCLVRCSNGLMIAINCVVHGCLLQIISDTSLGNSDVIDAVVFDGFLQGFCEDDFDPLVQTGGTSVICHERSPGVKPAVPVTDTAGVQVKPVVFLASRSFR